MPYTKRLISYYTNTFTIDVLPIANHSVEKNSHNTRIPISPIWDALLSSSSFNVRHIFPRCITSWTDEMQRSCTVVSLVLATLSVPGALCPTIRRWFVTYNISSPYKCIWLPVHHKGHLLSRDNTFKTEQLVSSEPRLYVKGRLYCLAQSCSVLLGCWTY